MSPLTDPGRSGGRQDPAKERCWGSLACHGAGDSEFPIGGEGLGDWLETHLLNEFTVWAHGPITSFIWASVSSPWRWTHWSSSVNQNPGTRPWGYSLTRFGVQHPWLRW